MAHKIRDVVDVACEARGEVEWETRKNAKVVKSQDCTAVCTQLWKRSESRLVLCLSADSSLVLASILAPAVKPLTGSK